ncbi:MAG: sugar transferase [Defluviitaleaceae bacterium]|nr:sugar transferase [Defluviitaleaceae bacterium]
MYRHYLKRLFDLVAATLVLMLLLPLFLLLCLVIKLDSKGPVFFRQRRIGKGKTEFLILKFRSMRIDAPKDQPTHLLQNPAAYITRFGQFLRQTSLDELPQLINIIAGQMSVVGPRPALYNQEDLIELRDQYGANDVRPGLTGWAQVNGRDELPIAIKSKFDGEYIEKMSFLFDLKCIFRTFKSVSTAEGIVEGQQREKHD